MTVFGPATESSTYVLLAPALAGALIDARGNPTAYLPRAVLFASYSLFLASQATIWFAGRVGFINWGSHPFAGLLLFGCLVLTSLRQSAEGEGSMGHELLEHPIPSYGRPS
jgi:hypothetical protein